MIYPRPLPQQYVDAARAAPFGEQRAEVVRLAWSWRGTPWLHENRVKGAAGGVDCGNFVAAVFAEAGLIEAPALMKYPHDFYMHSKEEIFRAHLDTFCLDLGLEAPTLPGDIISLRAGLQSVTHTAIVLAWPKVIHASRSDGGVIDADGHRGVLRNWRSGTWRLRAWC